MYAHGWQTQHICCAAIHPFTFEILEASPGFQQWFLPQSEGQVDWLAPWSDESKAQFYQRYQAHLLYQLLQNHCPSEIRSSILDDAVVLDTELGAELPFRAIECWLTSDYLTLQIQDDQTEADLNLDAIRESLQGTGAIADVYQSIDWNRYTVDGCLWLEAADVTRREQTLTLNHQLMSHRALVDPSEETQFLYHLQSVVNAQQLLLCGVFQDHLCLLTSRPQCSTEIKHIPLSQLQDSAIAQAIHTCQVQSVPDLETVAHQPFYDQLCHQGRSLLVIPLTHHTGGGGDQVAIAGLAMLVSDTPHAFHRSNNYRIQPIIPALKTALTLALQTMQQRRLIRNVHPAVERHFIREAERRSWGLPPEPIVFKDLYPLYGISDIRGSSTERNHAIQVDLLAQFELARRVVTAACDLRPSAFCGQIQQELEEQIHHLEQGVTVDTEFAALDYLQTQIEVYFPHFEQLGDAAKQAVQDYHRACDESEGTVYRARADYDQAVNQINQHLRALWETCQVDMQAITPHYCDMEASDGIDHMIYAGEAIDPQFSLFHLRSLRYEQLRSMCRCARSIMRFKSTLPIPLDVAHLVLVQDTQIDIFHDEKTERLFDVQGTKDTRYEIVKKRIDKGVDQRTQERITQPGMLTIVYSLDSEWEEYEQYLRYLQREGWIEAGIETGSVEPLQGVTGLRFARVRVAAERE
jgi:hypothetical protein